MVRDPRLAVTRTCAEADAEVRGQACSVSVAAWLPASIATVEGVVVVDNLARTLDDDQRERIGFRIVDGPFRMVLVVMLPDARTSGW